MYYGGYAMRYKEGLHSVLEGITKDVHNIAIAISNLENEVEEENKSFTNKNVTIIRNGEKLCCKLIYNELTLVSEITLFDIYNAVKGRIIDDYEEIICDLIEEDVIKKSLKYN